MSLRFKRYYKPYRIHLDKFRFDRFPGTQKAKNYSSDVRVQDEAGNDLFPYHIAMNEPLRYEGETFYQSSFDDRTETTTILQVVKNPGWLLPYIACVVVGLGLIVHFLIHLIPFLRRNASALAVKKPEAAPAPVDPEDYFASNAPDTPPSTLVRYFPAGVVAFAILFLLSVGARMTPPKQPFDYDAAARMRVNDGGRVKPLDTYARVQLRMISGREEVVDNEGNKLPAIRWYLDTIATGDPDHRGKAFDYKIFRIDNERLLGTLKLDKREGYRYSMNELASKYGVLQGELDKIEAKVNAGKKLDTDETKVKELRDRIETYLDVVALGGKPAHGPDGRPKLGPDGKPLYEGLQLMPPRSSEDWRSLRKFRAESQKDNMLVGLMEARPFVAPRAKNLTEEDAKKILRKLGVKPEEMKPEELAKSRERLAELLQGDPRKMPDPQAKQFWMEAAIEIMSPEEVKKVNDAMDADIKRRREGEPAAGAWARVMTAYREEKPNDFAQAVQDYNRLVDEKVPDRNEGKNGLEKLLYSPFNSLGHNKVEITYNRFAPFYWCAGLYVLALLLALAGFSQQAAGRPHWAVALRRSAFYLLVLTFIVHAVAMFARMYLMERPLVFVTNLYSSAIFIGLGCVGLCLIIERIFPMGVGNALAALLGLVTTIVAHNIATEDTLEMMQAVLDTNFWLATHVTTVTLGYTATFVAGFLGAFYVFQMLGAVIRDSYLKAGEPTLGELLAFGTAAMGVVGIPIIFLGFMTSAADKFELLPTSLLWGLFGLVTAAGVIYALALMLQRVGSPGVDAHGKPLPGQIPNVARPVTAMALTPESGKIFGQMVYGVVCFATLLSFVGTVLGGIWADQSWGRFWGWDPKENGAVLIVLWNSLILHARWAGLVKDRGVAVLAIFGNCITAWSWFGTNQLSIGLHAYGFDSRLADGCFNFWMSQLLILGLGLIPQRFWASATRPVATAAPVAVTPTTAPNASTAAPKSPSTSVNGSPNGTPSNGHVNGQPNGQPNGHPRRDKKKRHGKK
jgi:ABC-type transport system involved in cytochrome c biogenesis permease subunit